MTHRIGRIQRIGMAVQFPCVQLVMPGQPLQRFARFACRTIQLGTIAGGQYGRLTHGTGSLEICQGLLQMLGRERHPLSNGERRAVMVEAESEELHCRAAAPLRAGNPARHIEETLSCWQ